MRRSRLLFAVTFVLMIAGTAAHIHHHLAQSHGTDATKALCGYCAVGAHHVITVSAPAVRLSVFFVDDLQPSIVASVRTASGRTAASRAPPLV